MFRHFTFTSPDCAVPWPGTRSPTTQAPSSWRHSPRLRMLLGESGFPVSLSLRSLLGLTILMAACATLEQDVDVDELAGRFALPSDELGLFLEGYEQGYEDGELRNAGIYAGTGHGNVPGPKGRGWVLGHEHAVDGRPKRDAEELADYLSKQKR